MADAVVSAPAFRRTGGTRRPSMERLMVSAVPGAFAAVCLNPFVISSVLQSEGASVPLLSLVPAVVQGAGFLGIPIALLMSRFPPKTAFLLPFALSRLSFFFFVLPLMLNLGTPWLLFGIFVGAKALAGGSMGAMHSWLRGVIPTRIQPTYFGRRTGLGLVLSALGTLGIGWALQNGGSFQQVLAIGLIMAVLDVVLLWKVQESGPSNSTDYRESVQIFLQTWKQKASWRLVARSTTAHVGFCLLLPFQLPFYFALGLSTPEIAILTTAQGLCSGLGAWIGGRVAKTHGPLNSLSLGSAITALAALTHLLMPHTLTGMLLPASLVGTAFGCLMLSSTQLMYQQTGPATTATYSALVALLLGGQLALMSLATALGTLLEHLEINFAQPVFSLSGISATIGFLILVQQTRSYCCSRI